MMLLLYLLVGAGAGVLAGLFGVGGGIIIVPVLVLVFQAQGFSADVLTHLAIGTSLATIMVTSISSIAAHHKKQAVLWPVFIALSPGILLGSWLGVHTAALLSGSGLQKTIGTFAILVSLQMAFEIRPAAVVNLPGNRALAGVGTGIGWVSAIFGIGGGTLTVPFLVWCNTRMQNAVATSAACGLPIAIAGVFANMQAGWQHPALPEGSSGFIYWPAFLGIVLSSALFAKLGAWLAHRLSVQLLRRLFALLLFGIGAQFCLKGIF